MTKGDVSVKKDSDHTGESEFMFLSKYAYSDLTVFMRTGENDYLNITDFSVTEKENERVAFKSDSPFVIMFCSLFYTAFKGKGAKPYVCDLSFEELVELSGVRDKAFMKKFNSVFGEEREKLFAILCAKKMLDYQCGKIVKDAENTYSFYRQGYTLENGKHKKKKVLIFTKEFYEA